MRVSWWLPVPADDLRPWLKGHLRGMASREFTAPGGPVKIRLFDWSENPARAGPLSTVLWWPAASRPKDARLLNFRVGLSPLGASTEVVIAWDDPLLDAFGRELVGLIDGRWAGTRAALAEGPDVETFPAAPARRRGRRPAIISGLDPDTSSARCRKLLDLHREGHTFAQLALRFNASERSIKRWIQWAEKAEAERPCV